MGVWARGACKNLGPPIYLFLQPLKLTNSNLVYNLGLGSSLPRNNFYDENWQGAGLGEHPKNLGPLFISATVKPATTNLVYKLGLGSSLPRNNF